MILLDTNYLIALVLRERTIELELNDWVLRGEKLQTSAIVWAEFTTGAVSRDDLRRIRFLIEDQIIAFGAAEAECAGRLYRDARCKRDQRMDAFIAATAIVATAGLATRNRRDFTRFVPFGLKLMQ